MAITPPFERGLFVVASNKFPNFPKNAKIKICGLFKVHNRTGAKHHPLEINKGTLLDPVVQNVIFKLIKMVITYKKLGPYLKTQRNIEI